jgi:phosphoribosyl-AMP cyclohydrolase
LTQFPNASVRLVDWDLVQIQANLLINFLPSVLDRCEELARECNAQLGSAGAWIEDAASGTVLLQQAQAQDLAVTAIESTLTSLGKDARAVNVSGYIFKGQCKITREAYEKTCVYHGRTRNHLWYQATTYRVGQGTTSDEDELFDTLCYGVELGLGDNSMFT